MGGCGRYGHVNYNLLQLPLFFRLRQRREDLEMHRSVALSPDLSRVMTAGKTAVQNSLTRVRASLPDKQVYVRFLTFVFIILVIAVPVLGVGAVQVNPNAVQPNQTGIPIVNEVPPVYMPDTPAETLKRTYDESREASIRASVADEVNQGRCPVDVILGKGLPVSYLRPYMDDITGVKGIIDRMTKIFDLTKQQNRPVQQAIFQMQIPNPKIAIKGLEDAYQILCAAVVHEEPKESEKEDIRKIHQGLQLEIPMTRARMVLNADVNMGNHRDRLFFQFFYNFYRHDLPSAQRMLDALFEMRNTQGVTSEMLTQTIQQTLHVIGFRHAAQFTDLEFHIQGPLYDAQIGITERRSDYTSFTAYLEERADQIRQTA